MFLLSGVVPLLGRDYVKERQRVPMNDQQNYEWTHWRADASWWDLVNAYELAAGTADRH